MSLNTLGTFASGTIGGLYSKHQAPIALDDNDANQDAGGGSGS